MRRHHLPLYIAFRLYSDTAEAFEGDVRTCVCTCSKPLRETESSTEFRGMLERGFRRHALYKCGETRPVRPQLPFCRRPHQQLQCSAGAEPDRFRREEAQRLFQSLQRAPAERRIGSEYGEASSELMLCTATACHALMQVAACRAKCKRSDCISALYLPAVMNPRRLPAPACRASWHFRCRAGRRTWTWTR